MSLINPNRAADDGTPSQIAIFYLPMSHKLLPSTLYIMPPMHLQNLKLLRQTANKKIHLQESTLFDLGVSQNVAKYPLHHVTFAPAKFEVATSNNLGGDAFTREYIT